MTDRIEGGCRGGRARHAASAAVLAAALALGLAGGANAQFIPPAAQARETAAAFAQRVVALYAPNGPFWSEKGPAADAAFNRKVDAAFYDPSFAKLISDNGALAGRWGGGPDLDYDPVCQCQDDPGGLVVERVTERPGGFADVAMVSGLHETGSKPTAYSLVLQRGPAGWRITDVVDQTGSLRALLTRHNACLRKARSDAAAGRCLD